MSMLQAHAAVFSFPLSLVISLSLFLFLWLVNGRSFAVLVEHGHRIVSSLSLSLWSHCKLLNSASASVASISATATSATFQRFICFAYVQEPNSMTRDKKWQATNSTKKNEEKIKKTRNNCTRTQKQFSNCRKEISKMSHFFLGNFTSSPTCHAQLRLTPYST